MNVIRFCYRALRSCSRALRSCSRVFRSSLAKLLSPSADDVIKGLEDSTRREQERTERLNRTLKAKQDLAQVQADNIKLQRKISRVGVGNIEGEAPKQSVKPKMRQL